MSTSPNIVPPSNVVPIEKGKKMADMLVSGELVAAIGVDIDHPDVKPLIPNALDAGLASLKSSGHYPINHLVVIKDDLIADHPELAARRVRRVRRNRNASISTASKMGRSRSRPPWTRSIRR